MILYKGRPNYGQLKNKDASSEYDRDSYLGNDRERLVPFKMRYQILFVCYATRYGPIIRSSLAVDQLYNVPAVALLIRWRSRTIRKENVCHVLPKY